MERVRDLADYLAHASVINLSVVRTRIWELFFAMDHENSRVGLLAIYHIVMMNVVRGSECDSGDASVTGTMRESMDIDKCAFAIFEAINAGKHFDRTEFERIVRREVAAGRMRGDEPDRFSIVAAAELRNRQTAYGHGINSSGGLN